MMLDASDLEQNRLLQPFVKIIPLPCLCDPAFFGAGSVALNGFLQMVIRGSSSNPVYLLKPPPLPPNKRYSVAFF